MKEGCSGGASLCEGFHEGDLGGGLLYWGAKKMRFFRDMQNACRRVSLSTGAPVGNLEGVRLPGLLGEKEVYMGSLLGPGGIWAIWNFVKGTGLL